MEETGMLNGAPVRQDSKKLWQYFTSISVCLLAVGVGTAMAWTAPILPVLYEPDNWLVITKDEGSWVGSLLALGAMLGALPSGKMADKLGRKKSLMLLTGPFLLSWLIIIVASSAWMLYVARLIVGTSVGATCVLVPTYISEVAETSTRGTLGAFFQLFLTAGILLVNALGSFVNYTTLAIICALVEVAFLATFFWMPESPQWLVNMERRPEAEVAMKVLRGDSYNPNEEITIIESAKEEASSKKSSFLDIFRTVGSRRAFICSCGGMLFQQLSGVNAVIFNTLEIFQAAGSSLPSDVAAIIVSLVQVIMSGAAAAIVDRAGRKPLLMFSSGMLAICLLALGIYFKKKDDGDDVSSLGWLPLASLTLFMIAFSIGLGPVPWMLTSELFTAELKGIVSSVAVMLNWFLVFCVTKLFPSMTEKLGMGGTFWFFAVIMVIATVLTYFILPETKGKSIREIQDELNGV
ncbi:facilitated trehalose transporter Tret1-like isoform X1 [Vespa mandarinia]|uniref:facilitated trehalose transporter Tret1-like isoform X1 n=2 Tax=Vespa mandarinia TaxID=7446 RepID=UPI0016172006|nr:facilitated trehalose transporter Tret1-like isoform X1 [Vespa mandarinia]XP_035726578.1 facilitated trehalose transporter Tret1-like isoform X1 [Vespa mandarinia]